MQPGGGSWTAVSDHRTTLLYAHRPPMTGGGYFNHLTWSSLRAWYGIPRTRTSQLDRCPRAQEASGLAGSFEDAELQDPPRCAVLNAEPQLAPDIAGLIVTSIISLPPGSGSQAKNGPAQWRVSHRRHRQN